MLKVTQPVRCRVRTQLLLSQIPETLQALMPAGREGPKVARETGQQA